MLCDILSGNSTLTYRSSIKQKILSLQALDIEFDLIITSNMLKIFTGKESVNLNSWFVPIKKSNRKTNIINYLISLGYDFVKNDIKPYDESDQEQQELFGIILKLITRLSKIIKEGGLLSVFLETDSFTEFNFLSGIPNYTPLLHAIHSQNKLVTWYIVENIHGDDDFMNRVYEYRDVLNIYKQNALEAALGYLQLDIVEILLGAYPTYHFMRVNNSSFDSICDPEENLVHANDFNHWISTLKGKQNGPFCLRPNLIHILCALNEKFFDPKLNEINRRLLQNEIIYLTKNDKLREIYYYVEYYVSDGGSPIHYIFGLISLLFLNNVRKFKAYGYDPCHLETIHHKLAHSFTNLHHRFPSYAIEKYKLKESINESLHGEIIFMLVEKLDQARDSNNLFKHYIEYVQTQTGLKFVENGMVTDIESFFALSL